MKTCSLCKIEKPFTDFNRNVRKSDGLQTHCRDCGIVRSKAYYAANPEKHKLATNDIRRELRMRNRQYVLDYLKTHPCVDCSERDPIVLEFDHVKGCKSADIAQLIGKASSTSVIEEEIAKCEVRCANCHRKRTAQTRNWWKISQ